MRHHRVEEPHQDVAGFPQSPGEVGSGRGFDGADGVRQRIGAFVDMRDTAVEAQPGDIVGDVGQRPVGGLADDQRLLAELGRARGRRFDVGDLPDQPPQPLHEAPGALHALLGPDHVALGR